MFNLKPTGSESKCGFPCCHGTGDLAESGSGFLPNELTGFYDPDAYTSFLVSVNKTLHRSHWPHLPTIFLPVLGMCIIWGYRSLRKSWITKVVNEENARIRPFGLFWKLGDFFESDFRIAPDLLQLSVHGSTRLQFEAQNPTHRKFQPGSFGSAVVSTTNYPVPVMRAGGPSQQQMSMAPVTDHSSPSANYGAVPPPYPYSQQQ